MTTDSPRPMRAPAATLLLTLFLLLALIGVPSAAANAAGAATPVGVRPAPIIYRPSWEPASKPIPLVVAFYGSQGSPQAMENLTGFQKLASRSGFEVVYPGSVGGVQTPWLPHFNDISYVSALISQLEAPGNGYGAVDPNRVYMAGFSLGGDITWQGACQLSNKVAGVAIVSMMMAPSFAHSCHPKRPVSELLIIGTADSRYRGIPGRVGSATQTTALWRSIDGCPSSVQLTPSLAPSVSQEQYSRCVDGTSVGLITIAGGGHTWPGPGHTGALAVDNNISASPVIWSFFSQHPGAPLRLTGTDLKLGSVAVKQTGHKRQIVLRLHALEPGVTLKLTFSHHVHQVHLGQGSDRIVLSVRASVKAGRYQLKLVFTDTYKRGQTDYRFVRLPA